MKDHEVAILGKVLQQLDSLEEHGEPECAIAAETYDQAILFGTAESLLALAAALIRVAYASVSDSGGDERFERDEKGIGASDSIKGLLYEFSDVWPVCVIVASCQEHYDELKRELLVKHGHGGH